jgi:hypothetical protein
MHARAQDSLLRQVVVMMHGGAVAIEWIKDQVDGIVDAFYPGENGGQAIVDVLFGDYNPGGTLNHLLLCLCMRACVRACVCRVVCVVCRVCRVCRVVDKTTRLTGQHC